MNRPQRLLVRGVNWLGDAVMTTPALLRLRDALPGTTITILTPAKLAGLWVSHPAVDDVLAFEPGANPWAVSRVLRRGQFDAALVLPNSTRSALECFLARIPRRIGRAGGWRSWLLTSTVPDRPTSRRMEKPSPRDITDRIAGRVAPAPIGWDAHHSRDYLHLAAALGASSEPRTPKLVVRDDEIDAARAKFGMGHDALWLGVNPGAEYGPAKRWPADRFAAVAREISAATGARWMIFGGPNDTGAADAIAAAVPNTVNLAGRTSLRELMAVLAVCRVLLTNDTGPMHVAAALGTRVVVPFGSTSPELTGPGLPGDSSHRLLRTNAPCAPCFLRECPIDFRCLLGIDVPNVVAAIRDAIR